VAGVPAAPRRPLAMVHQMDSLSAKWRDDPVRAALERKKARENQAAAREEASKRASQLLERKLAQASKGVDARDTDQPNAVSDDADYKKVQVCYVYPRAVSHCDHQWPHRPIDARRLSACGCIGRCWRGIGGSSWKTTTTVTHPLKVCMTCFRTGAD
jgi:hypothetical protein